MNIIRKRKTSKSKTIEKNIKSLEVGDLWVYGSGKLPDDEYHKLPFLSAHIIKDLADRNLSDYHLYRKFIKRDLPQPDSAAFAAGRAFHTAVLEPHLYKQTYAVQPKFDRRTKQGKADAAEWDEQNKGKQIITSDQHNQVAMMARTVRSNSYAKALLSGGENELSGFTRLDDGTLLRGRIDTVNFSGCFGVDVKSIEDVSPAGFAKHAARYRYDLQAYTYQKLFGLNDFVFIACSKQEPYEVAVYMLNDEFMQKAEDDFNAAVERWKRLHSVKTPESFSSSSSPLTVLAPPKWFIYS